MNEKADRERSPQDFAEGMAQSNTRDSREREIWRQIAQKLGGNRRDNGSQGQRGG